VQASIRVFIVAENRLLREALGRIFDKQKDVKIVGTARLCTEALPDMSSTRPEVLLLNPVTSTFSDLDDLQKIPQRSPKPKVVVFGMEEDEKVFLTAVRRGVVGYVLKDAYASDMVAAVRSVARGEAVCPPRLCLCLFTHVAKQTMVVPNPRLHIHLGLTRREQELIPMIAQGLTNKEIAGQLNVSEQTVKNHVHRMMQKAGANSRLDVVERCRSSRLAL
jgi:DNA-binding NarL/FixJ family response regulator